MILAISVSNAAAARVALRHPAGFEFELLMRVWFSGGFLLFGNGLPVLHKLRNGF
jgi:hypothetical protein